MKELTFANAGRNLSKAALVGGLNGVIFAALIGGVAWAWSGEIGIGAVIAAAVIGVNPSTTKVTAFGISSFFTGVAGAMFAVAITALVPFWLGFTAGGPTLGLDMLLMVPAMLAVMLYRVDEYSKPHRPKSASPPARPPATLKA